MLSFPSFHSALHICFLLNPSPKKFWDFFFFLIAFFPPIISNQKHNCVFSLGAHVSVTDASISDSGQLPLKILLWAAEAQSAGELEAVQFESWLWTRLWKVGWKQQRSRDMFVAKVPWSKVATPLSHLSLNDRTCCFYVHPDGDRQRKLERAEYHFPCDLARL